jgi:hypothetical protein
MFLVPVVVAQQQPVSPPPSEVHPPQTPSETPSTTEGDPLRRDQKDSNTPPTTFLPETYGREDRAVSWGSLIGGMILGGGIGYFIGRRSGNTNTARRDRAA